MHMVLTFYHLAQVCVFLQLFNGCLGLLCAAIARLYD
jgi:hypothetical protein